MPCGGSGTGTHRVRADDGVVLRTAEALSDIPAPSDNFTVLEDRLRDKGLDLSGGSGRPERAAERWRMRQTRAAAVAIADPSDGAAPTRAADPAWEGVGSRLLVGPGSGSDGPRSELRVFFLKIDFCCQLGTADSKNGLFLVS
jgi:hypothetical protein